MQSHNIGIRILVSTVVVLACGRVARGGADYVQGFDNNGAQTQDGPANLVAEGWIFSNQSDNALEDAGWFDGAGYNQTPQSGASCLYTASINTIPFLQGGTLSNWAVLPEISGQAAGDVLSFFLLGTSPQWGDQKIEVRYAADGGTDTGNGPDEFGDFTQLLADFATDTSWQQVTVTLPGPGRLALRQFDPYTSNYPNGGVLMNIDALTIGSEASAPCGMTLPQSGDTVTWTLADSPYTVCEQLTIPPGGTVVVEPGVTIHVQTGGPQLVISGTLIAHGTQAQPITITGDNYSVIDPPIEVLSGTLDLQFATIAARIQSKYGGTVLASDCTIPAAGTIAADPLQAQDPDGPVPQALVFNIERCSFEGGELSAISNVRVVDTDFVGGRARIGGYVFVHNVTVDGVPLEIEKDAGAQPALVDHVTVTNHTAGGGLQLSGASYHVGPNTVIQNNRYPVEFTVLGAGLTPDSVLPAAGNTENVILTNGQRAGNNLTWPDLGLPYVVNQSSASLGGRLTVLPGTRVLYDPGAGAIFGVGAQVRMSGTPTVPILLEPSNPALGWAGIEFLQLPAQRVQNVEMRGAEFGMGSDESFVTVIDSIFEDNVIGGIGNTFGRITARACRFVDNGVGLATGSTSSAGSFDASSSTMPNSFTGNGVGVQVNSPVPGNSSEARHAWWGSAGGPTHPFNPGGDGDAAEIGITSVTPFLTEAPGYADHAPLVEMEPAPIFAHVGDRLMIRWQIADDNGIVSQRVEYSQAAGGFPFETLAELGPGARSYEYQVQVVPPTPVNSPAALRVVAVDGGGNESWDVVFFWVPYQEDWTVPDIVVSSPPQTLRPGDFFQVTWSPGATATLYLELDSERSVSAHGGGFLPVRMPYASTDLARFLVRLTYGAGGREAWYYSDYFSIRPDDRIADAAPQVTLMSPQAGASYPGGTVVPVSWAASDDEGLRDFDIQASYDGGVTWWDVARGLSADTTSFNWLLPASAGIADARVRVTARDLRFQTTSDGTEMAFAITPGDVGGCPTDLDGDALVGAVDLAQLLGAWGPNAGHPADFTMDGLVNAADLALLLGTWGACE